MGRLQAEEMREMLGRRQALEWHLQHNHYPPVHPIFIDAAEEAIENANCGNWDTQVGLPNGRVLTTAQVIKGLHLDPWLEER